MPERRREIGRLLVGSPGVAHLFSPTPISGLFSPTFLLTPANECLEGALCYGVCRDYI